VTSECTAEMQQAAEEAGALFFIIKPFTAERFDEVFSPILG
jgi:two-component system, chemotaxis family, chemotaxis protein CheY